MNRHLEGKTTEDKITVSKLTLKSDIIASSVTYATNKYSMECMTNPGIDALEDTPVESGAAPGGAGAAFKIFARSCCHFGW
jgi:hypothetical protein